MLRFPLKLKIENFVIPIRVDSRSLTLGRWCWQWRAVSKTVFEMTIRQHLRRPQSCRCWSLSQIKFAVLLSIYAAQISLDKRTALITNGVRYSPSRKVFPRVCVHVQIVYVCGVSPSLSSCLSQLTVTTETINNDVSLLSQSRHIESVLDPFVPLCE